MNQLSLFGQERIEFDATFATLERVSLREGAWVDVARGWLRGHAQLFDTLLAKTEWRTEERTMYDRTVEAPRRYAVLTKQLAQQPRVLTSMQSALDARYGTRFERVSMALYRDGRDSVAWHGDHVARRLPEALVATVSIGAPRRFLLRPKGGGASLGFSLGWGDLAVMGGTCQRTYDHCIPKVAKAEPRIAIMYRPIWESPA